MMTADDQGGIGWPLTLLERSFSNLIENQETITTPIEKPQALGSWCIVKTTYVLDGVADETC